jgi:predicted NBD/HSP70 family sugar kinase
MSPAEKVVAGIDLGGTAINYTFLDERGEFLIEGLCEHPGTRHLHRPDR